MKRIVLAAIAAGLSMSAMAQTDSTAERVDTIKVGGMIIIKKRGANGKEEKTVEVNHTKKAPSNPSTNWFIIDLGVSNFNDKTNYASAMASGFTGAGVGKDQLEPRPLKSVNVNIWFFMQRLNVIKKVVNLKYGLGLELNNYHFDDETVRFTKNPTTITIDPALKAANVKKNKLAADYITVPIMLNFNFTPNKRKSFGLSAGVSAGYLYSSRQKIKTTDDKWKLKDDFDLRRWKLSYIGELNLGPVRLYGSYAMESMWEKGLDQTPYTVGIRFSRW